MMQRACSLILLMVFLVTGPVHVAAANKKLPSSFNFLRLKSSSGVRAPLVIEPGVLTSSSEDGSIEFDGNDLYITKSGVKTVLGGEGTKGEKGDKGDKGDQGERGLRGLAGPSGPSGPAGSFSGGDAVVSGILSFSTGRLQNAVLNGTSLFRSNSIAKFNGSILIPASAANGKVLTSNGGGLASWKTLPTSTPGGSLGQIQINNSGSFAGNGSLFWDFTNKRLGVGTTTPAELLSLVTTAGDFTDIFSATNTYGQKIKIGWGSGGAGLLKSNNSDAIWLNGRYNGVNRRLVGIPSDSAYAFGTSTNFNEVIDTAIARNAAGILEVNNGSAGSWAALRVGTRSAGTQPLIVKAAASQTANLTEWQNSAGTVSAYMNPSGQLTANAVYGTTGVQAPTGGNGFFFNNSGFFIASSSGVFKFSDNTDTSFNRLQFGGTTSSYPAIKRNAAAINFRLADDSADASITAGAAAFSGNVGIGTASPARKLHISEAMRIEPQSSPPASPSAGDLYVDSDGSQALCIYLNGVWVVVGGAGSCS